ncbi:MAG: hypothetical protein WCT23_06355 [Candidatus Neomarinimicrobiota bacterium]
MSTNKFFESLGLTKTNLYIFLAAIAVLIIGYIVMAIGDTYDALSLYVSPIILTIGYVVVLPMSILYKSKNSE